MINKRAKGQRTLKKAIDYLKSNGYWVEKTEVNKAVWIKGRIIPVRYDVLASDLAAVKDGILKLIQVKSNHNDKYKGVEELKKIPPIQKVKKEVWVLEDRKKEPDITEVE